MAFCGKCGAPLGEGKFCGNCGAPREDIVYTSEMEKTERNMPQGNKKILVGIGIVGAILLVIIGVRFLFRPVVNEPCDWCGESPSVAYELSDGSEAYVCRECSEYCMLCGDEKATQHYENLIGTMMFVCDDCYEGIAGD